MADQVSDQIIRSRQGLFSGLAQIPRSDETAEGGCGVLGFASNIPVAGQHVLTASRQMHNRGNGKGGGIAMVGLDAIQAKVPPQVLRSHTLLQVALLDPQARSEIESLYIEPVFEITQAYEMDHLDDYRDIPGLAVRPPDIVRYFARVKSNVLDRFADEQGLSAMNRRSVEDEFIYQNSFRLNRQFYASLGEKRAFVLSHGRNLSVLKMVGYAEDVVEYYRLQDQTAHVWIAHQRYPTKGRVWHPGGAHPFIGLNEALVHNGDFANYHAVSEYLQQRNIGQLFLTDTEVSVQLFDLWDRVYRYPLEITLEAMAPTSEFDFEMLPEEKKKLYQAVQRAHLHGSPDGPWFFILARSLAGSTDRAESSQDDVFELLGITDTSMLRPQVFALFENLQAEQPVQIGLIASERQAIHACLRSLSAGDPRFQPVADRYWVARGGSYTDGGAFRFTVHNPNPGSLSSRPVLVCRDKFERQIDLDRSQWQLNNSVLQPQDASDDFQTAWWFAFKGAYAARSSPQLQEWLMEILPKLDWGELAWSLDRCVEFAGRGPEEWKFCLEVLNFLRDRRYDTGRKKRASILPMVDQALERIFEPHALNWDQRETIAGLRPGNPEPLTGIISPLGSPLILDVAGFPPEGDKSAAQSIVRAYQNGWRWIIAYNWRGGRFAGCGIGPNSQSLRLDLYGDIGDYAASGLDGAQVTLHGDGQDQLGQILKSGRLVIHGDAGQTFLYGAKGGEIFVLGSVAGRPLINAVGKPRAVINGTCLDYLAESFMAGDPLNGGGFVILNGVTFNPAGELIELETPYPGGNLFSLASGGCIYLRDPHHKVMDEQLNGGTFTPLSDADWQLIEPYLHENEQLFGVRVEDLLRVDGKSQLPANVYRKVAVKASGVLREAQANPSD